MDEGFYPAREPDLGHRRFLKLDTVAGMAPALTSDAYEGRDLDDGVRLFIECHAVNPADPWALGHALRITRKGCNLNGENTLAYVLRIYVRAQEANGRRCSLIPTRAEVHTNTSLETSLEAGVAGLTAFPIEDWSFRLEDLSMVESALFRVAPSLLKRNDLAWGQITFAELDADEWVTAFGQRVNLQEVATFGLQALQEATESINPNLKTVPRCDTNCQSMASPVGGPVLAQACRPRPSMVTFAPQISPLCGNSYTRWSITSRRTPTLSSGTTKDSHSPSTQRRCGRMRS
jgi:hypothetical protein